jgi:hypothetical protein
VLLYIKPQFIFYFVRRREKIETIFIKYIIMAILREFEEGHQLEDPNHPVEIPPVENFYPPDILNLNFRDVGYWVLYNASDDDFEWADEEERQEFLSDKDKCSSFYMAWISEIADPMVRTIRDLGYKAEDMLEGHEINAEWMLSMFTEFDKIHWRRMIDLYLDHAEA